MTEQQLFDILKDTIAFNLRHADYVQTREKRKFCRSSIGGVDQEEEVQRSRRFELDHYIKQRNRLYNSPTKAALAVPRKHFRRIYALEGQRIKQESADAVKLQLLKMQLHDFLPGQTLEMWLNRELERLGANDPNAWILYERENTVNQSGAITGVKTYPLIYSAEDAINFSIRRGVVEWVIFRYAEMQTTVAAGIRKDEWVENLYLYAPGQVLRMREVGPKTVFESGETVIDIEVYPNMKPPESGEMDKAKNPPQYMANMYEKKTRRFYYSYYENGTIEVPAMRVGAYLDEITEGRTFVSWFDPAEHLIKDLIRYKSAKDVTVALHTYPKRYEFTAACKFRHPETGAECVGGWLNDIHTEEHMCPSCRGTGKASNFNTEQEVLQLALPEDTANILELATLYHNEPIDISFPEWLDQQIEKTSKRILQTIFSAGQYQKPDNTVTRTATEVETEQEGLNDVLSPFADTYSMQWELCNRITAQYLEIPDFVCDHSFPDEKTPVTLTQLIEEYQKIMDAGVGYEAASAQLSKIMQKLQETRPEDRAWTKARFSWKPFADKSPDEVAFILSSRSPLDSDRILWENFVYIFNDIMDTDPEFPNYTREKQESVLMAEIEQLRQEITLSADLQPVEPVQETDTEESTDNADDTGV